MIISASYKTDIPTFYGEWFINRLRAGYCKMVNPYNGQVYTIDLSSESVDGFVFSDEKYWPFSEASSRSTTNRYSLPSPAHY